MKVTKNGLTEHERGYALVLTLVLLVVGALIVAPLLSLVGTGLKSGMVYEQKSSDFYAADEFQVAPTTDATGAPDSWSYSCYTDVINLVAADVELDNGNEIYNLVYIILSFRSEATTGGFLSYQVQ